ncbi:hypothetical protein Tco_0604570, partial [Tanacetum coccineum]
GRVMSTQEYIKKVVEDVAENEDFKSGSWVSATEYVNANGGIWFRWEWNLMEKEEEIVKLNRRRRNCSDLEILGALQTSTTSCHSYSSYTPLGAEVKHLCIRKWKANWEDLDLCGSFESGSGSMGVFAVVGLSLKHTYHKHPVNGILNIIQAYNHLHH